MQKQKTKDKGKPDRYAPWQIAAMSVLSLLLVYFTAMTIINLMTPDTPDRARLREQVIGDNLIDDESFEQANPLRDSLVWQLDLRSTDMIAEWTDDDSLTGDFALQFTTSKSGNQGHPGIFRDETIIDGMTYEFSAHVRSPDGASGWLAIELYNEDGDYVRGYSTGCPQPNEDWHELTYTLSPEQYREVEAADMRIGVLQCLNHSEGDQTTLIVDDISLVMEKK